MSEISSPSAAGRSGEPHEGSSGAGARRGSESLDSGHGSTTIADSVVTKIASIAAREVPGVHDLGGGTARAIGGFARSVGVGDERMQGVDVEVGEREAAVDLTVVVEYGESIPRIATALRENITRRIEGMAGLTVTEVNIAISDLYFPGDETPAEPARVE
ncbi:MAG TPA: Asp23/Gls24 family envelope stress response protein [Solirubrobacteraceae bacterium]|nr:Asp23/Gls24 family envelope stress response protein [Solirubrobacteraceae bacterium]